MTPPSLFPCAPTPQSHALCRPTSPKLRARCQDCVVCAPHLAVPPPSPRRPRCRPRQARGIASLSPRTHHPPPTSLLLPLAHPPTAYLCPLRWSTHRMRPPPHPSAHPGRLAKLFTRARHPRQHQRERGDRGRRRCRRDGGRGSDGASATGGLRGTTKASSAFARRPRRAAAASAAWRPDRHRGARSSATEEAAAGGGWRRRLGRALANDNVEVIVGRRRRGDSWHKIAILNDCGLLHSGSHM